MYQVPFQATNPVMSLLFGLIQVLNLLTMHQATNQVISLLLHITQVLLNLAIYQATNPVMSLLLHLVTPVLNLASDVPSDIFIHTGEFNLLNGLALSNLDDGYVNWISQVSYNNSVYIPTSSDGCKGVGFYWRIDSSNQVTDQKL